MNKNLITVISIAITISMGISSCTNNNAKATESMTKRKYVKEPNQVEIMVLEESTFKKELVSNGKLYAQQKSILKFRISDELENLYVKNGQRVNKGDKIGCLNKFKQKQALDLAKIGFQKTEFNLQDKLMQMGYSGKNEENVTPDILKTAKIDVGYYSSENSLKTAEKNYESIELFAPFSGIIANLKKKRFEMVGANEEFCTLIDDANFEVEFEVLETEIKEIKNGKKVKIIPFSTSKTSLGVVTEINPVVDENGLVKVKALVKNPGGFIEGMNVKVLVETNAPKKLVVPKSAVLIRDNQDVLFTVKAGKAYWTYVNIENENSTSYAVIGNPKKNAKLIPGDTVVTNGNLNLAHDSEVSY
jgi:RND family efflux transporter MFP subunit